MNFLTWIWKIWIWIWKWKSMKKYIQALTTHIDGCNTCYKYDIDAMWCSGVFVCGTNAFFMSHNGSNTFLTYVHGIIQHCSQLPIRYLSNVARKTCAKYDFPIIEYLIANCEIKYIFTFWMTILEISKILIFFHTRILKSRYWAKTQIQVKMSIILTSRLNNETVASEKTVFTHIFIFCEKMAFSVQKEKNHVVRSINPGISIIKSRFLNYGKNRPGF